MASSNRHWPSMFKSKPCTNTSSTHHQWQHDINSSLISSSAPCNRAPYPPGHGCEERTPEPKPRWNPRPEQIRILEAIFNSGMVNPPRDEIRKIRAQLQEYGQVGDANVFYWFQNRKSRSKHKQRLLHSPKPHPQPQPQPTAAPPPPPAFFSTPPPSSSSSDKTSSEKSLSVIDLLNSPTASVNQPFLHGSSDFLAEPFCFSVQQQNTTGVSSLTQEFSFPDVSGVAEAPNPSCLLSELMLMSSCPSKKDDDREKMKHQQQLCYADVTPPNAPNQIMVPPSYCVPSSPSNDQLLQGAGGGPTKSTVFINDVCFEVGGGPFNVREAFGDDAVLIHSSGQPVLTDDWGVTVHPLYHGAFYYLLRSFTPSPNQRTNFHLI